MIWKKKIDFIQLSISNKYVYMFDIYNILSVYQMKSFLWILSVDATQINYYFSEIYDRYCKNILQSII